MTKEEIIARAVSFGSQARDFEDADREEGVEAFYREYAR